MTTGYQITPYLDGDQAALRDICVRTAARGGDASSRHRHPELIPLVYLDPYVVHEPALVSVLRRSDDGVPVGYLVAAADTAAFERRLERDWWPALRSVYRAGAPGNTEYDDNLVRHIVTPQSTPAEVVAAYPAHLHIDLLAEARRQGWGRRLIDRLVEQLRERGVPGVHLGVGSANRAAQAFYRTLGFEALAEHDGGLLMGLSVGPHTVDA